MADLDWSWSNPGCEIWYLAEGSESHWSRKIDWYLNFQAMKAEEHKSKQVSAEIKKIEDEWPMESFHCAQSGPSPVMIASQGNLPCPKIVFSAFQGNLDSWVTDCVHVWRGLGKPQIRVFLPDNVLTDPFRSAWIKAAGISESIPESISAPESESVSESISE